MPLIFALLLLFSIALIGIPVGLSGTTHALGPASSSIMVLSGIVLVVLSASVLTITRLYVKTRASEAFVRTGMGGMQVIRDGGALVIPVVHQVVRVSLETIRLEVLRQGPEALITSDKLRADIKAEFFVRVQPNDEAIMAASRSLGDKMTNDYGGRFGGQEKSSVAALIEDKLVSALRTAAARKTLEQLNSERDEFLREVTQLVTADLNHNGFTLETVTISKLDQTDEQHLKDGNIFDAQGKRTIAEITQTNLTQRNEIVRRGEQQRTQQDVEARKKVLELERARAEAEAEQATQIAVITAEQERLAKEKVIEADRTVALAKVQQEQQVQVAKVQQEEQIQVAERQKIKSITQAEETVEVAKRTQQKAIAEAEAQRAEAEAKLAQAEAQRQKARQDVLTVEQIAAADREKQKAVIAATAEAEKSYVTSSKAADADAYRLMKEAEARKASADADAEAIRKKATAEAEALKARADGDKATQLASAEGQKAIAMVPVEVEKERVQVEKRRVEEVLKPELKAREESGKVAQDYELSRLRIEKEAEVRIATAQSTVQLYNKITANVYGTPEDVAKMGQAFSNGMGLSQAAGGFLAGADESTLGAVRKVGELVETAVQAVSGVKPGKGQESTNGVS